MKRILLIGAVAACCLSTAQANVYSCTVNGEKIYTNKKSGNCHVEKLDKIGSYSSDRTILERQNRLADASIAAQNTANTSSNHQAANNQTSHQASPPTHRPVKPVQTANNVPTRPANQVATAAPASSQAGRDQGRRAILMSELSNEKKALAQARLALVNGRLIRNQNDTRKQQSLASLQRAVDDRQQNIQALQNELARM